MRIWPGPALVLMASLASGPALAGLFSTTSTYPIRTDCHGLTLQYARGVPGDGDHLYTLAGTCVELQDTYVDGKKKGTDEIGRAFMKLGAKWDPKTNELKESAKLKGSTKGSLSSVFECGRDPYLYSTSCTLMAHSNTTDWPDLSKKPEHNVPIGAGKTNLAQATAESAKHKGEASAPPPPPPPAKPNAPKVTHLVPMHATSGAKVTMSPAARNMHLVPQPVSIEAETLAGTATSTSGKASVQPMGQFGSGWSDNNQLFWTAQQGDADLRLKVPGIVAGHYRLVLHLTRAPDYGILQVALNGNPLDATFNGYDPKVVPSGNVDLGQVALVGGDNVLDFHVIGKDMRSKGDYAGIDRIDLKPVK